MPSLKPTRHASQLSFNYWDGLKLLGILFMFADHIGYFFFSPGELWLRAIGRGTVPVFLFLTGYASRYRFDKELLALALLLAINDAIVAGGINRLNILFLIIGCRMIFAALEKRGKTIARPHEWFIACIVLVASILVIQYGSLGLLFAVAGYLCRRPETYTLRQREGFLAAAFVAYGLIQGFLLEFAAIDWLVMTATLGITWALLRRMNTGAIAPALPDEAKRIATFVARHSAYVYVLHIVALQWITGMKL